MEFFKNHTVSSIQDKFNSLKVKDVQKFISKNTRKAEILKAVTEGVNIAKKW